MPQYKLAARAEADRLDAEAELSAAQARRNIQRASNYVLGVVLFASALFFAGMSTKLTSPRLRIVDALHRLRRLPRHSDLDRDLAGQHRRLTTRRRARPSRVDGAGLSAALCSPPGSVTAVPSGSASDVLCRHVGSEADCRDGACGRRRFIPPRSFAACLHDGSDRSVRCASVSPSILAWRGSAPLTDYPFGGAVSVASAGSPRRSSRERSASALTSAPRRSASELSQSQVSMMITIASEPQVLS